MEILPSDLRVRLFEVPIVIFDSIEMLPSQTILISDESKKFSKSDAVISASPDKGIMVVPVFCQSTPSVPPPELTTIRFPFGTVKLS